MPEVMKRNERLTITFQDVNKNTFNVKAPFQKVLPPLTRGSSNLWPILLARSWKPKIRDSLRAIKTESKTLSSPHSIVSDWRTGPCSQPADSSRSCLKSQLRVRLKQSFYCSFTSM